MSPELCIAKCPSLQALRAIKSQVPTSVIGEIPWSSRQGCIVVLWRSYDAVAGSLCNKRKCQHEVTPNAKCLYLPNMPPRDLGLEEILSTKTLLWKLELSVLRQCSGKCRVASKSSRSLVTGGRALRQGDCLFHEPKGGRKGKGQKWYRVRVLSQAFFQYFLQIKC